MVDAPAAEPLSVDRSNWRIAPFNKAAFQRVRDIIPVAEVPAARAATSLESALRSLESFRLTLLDGAEIDLNGFLASAHVDALVVLQDGRLVHESYRDGMTARTPHIIMSATKAVTGLLAGALQAEGAIDVDAKVSTYVPEIATTLYGGARLRDLLDMRAGAALSAEEQSAYDYAANWEAKRPAAPPASLHQFFSALRGPQASHGGPFHYDSANTDLLGWVFERATGQTCAQLFSTRLWRPMGAEADAYITVDDFGAARCTGGLCATARDAARIGQLILDRGASGATQVVPAEWVEQIARGGDRDAWKAGEWGQALAAIGPDMGYRAGWYALNDASRTIFAMGIFGQNIFVDPTHRLVMAKLSSTPTAMDYMGVGLTHRAFPEIRRILTQDAP